MPCWDGLTRLERGGLSFEVFNMLIKHWVGANKLLWLWTGAHKEAEN